MPCDCSGVSSRLFETRPPFSRPREGNDNMAETTQQQRDEATPITSHRHRVPTWRLRVGKQGSPS
eukprot:15454638-Alexandrium_andersonii.AAC.1